MSNINIIGILFNFEQNIRELINNSFKNNNNITNTCFKYQPTIGKTIEIIYFPKIALIV